MDQKNLLLKEPITEQPNELSSNIDKLSPYEISSTLHKCDLEIFDGWHGLMNLTNVEMVTKMSQVAAQIEAVLKDPSSGTVVMSGCGTSGRLAFLIARRFNLYLRSQGKKECFQYIIAGKDQALFTSQELAEDDPVAGAKCLEEAVQGKSRVVYIGISCGLSALFVAGQLDLCLSDLKRFTPVVIGFNPVHLAREQRTQNWHKTFLTVMKELSEAEKLHQGFILNPVIGPEPITGSTRMKSGSATILILESLAMAAIHGTPVPRISQQLNCYRETCDSVYRHKDDLGKLIQLGGDSLNSGGHIYYLGSDGFGILAMIDASECPPTYSSSFDDLRGFTCGGYEAMENNDGNLSDLGEHYRISLEDFQTSVLPSIQDHDLLVIIGYDVYEQMEPHVKSLPCKQCFIGLDMPCLPPDFSANIFDLVINIQLEVPSLASLMPDHAQDVMRRLLQEMALKWTLNNLSTGAHILKGKVFENRMVDVKVSNNKLYFRALGIVQKVAQCSYSEAEENLLKSIYGLDEISAEIKSKTVVDHIKIGAECDQVVPTAILLASLRCSVQEAKQKISQQPVIRTLLDNASH